MDERELATLIDRQSRRAIGADDLTADQRAEAMEFYLGEAKGQLAPPDVPGRSSVVSKDLMDTVEWAMPALMDVFASADDIIKFEPDSPEDEKSAQDATNYIGYLIHRKNEDGFTTLHDAIKSALISRVGAGKCYVEETQDYREESYSGLSAQEVELLKGDPEIEVIEEMQDGVVEGPAMQPGQPPEMVMTFTVKARTAEQRKTYRNEGVPPEEIRIARDTRVINECRFIEHRREVTLSYLREQGYDEDKIALLSGDDGDAGAEYEAMVRHTYDGTQEYEDDETDASQREVWLSEAYLKVDFDGDGRTEYRRVVKANSVVFENDVVDDHPFWLLTPILMPYKIMGLGFWDLIEDLQRIKTALNRQVLDNVYLSNNPRTEVVESQIIDMDELLTPRVGGIVRVKNAGATREIAVPFVAAAGMELIQFVDGVRDTRTGVTEMNSAISAESFAQSNVGSQGVQALMSAGAQRIRLIARVLAETGFKRMYYLMLKNVTQYADKNEQVKINGRWLQVDPREWKNKYNMTVSVGVGTFGRQQQISNLQMIAQMQGNLMNMGLATPINVYNTAKRAIEAMGYRDADQFVSAPQMGPDGQPQKPPNPDAQKGQQEMQMAQMKMQGQMQIEQVKAQALAQSNEQQRNQEAQLERMRMQMQQQTDIVRQRAEAEQHQLKLQNEAQLAQLKMQLDDAKHARDVEFQQWKAQLESATKIQVAQLGSIQAPNAASMASEQEITREVRP